MEIHITQHAYIKARERFKWKNKTLDSMAVKAFIEGITQDQTKSLLNKYIEEKYKMHGCNNVKIYGQNIFMFIDNKLVTLYRLPNSLIKYLKV
jgi:hypothetical protein